MNRSRVSVDRNELTQWLRCVECGIGKLEAAESGLRCRGCEATFPERFGIPILLRQDNELFPQADYVPDPGQHPPQQEQPRRRINLPTRSINLCRDRNLRRIASQLKTEDECRVLVIGSGSQAHEVLAFFDSARTRFVFCDIATSGDLDLYCDAHELPFAEASFDGLITTAVMEHVLDPQQVAAEITRVVRPGGWVYSEIPFLQAVHMGAYDFTRFTLGGHRYLYRQFEEVDAGMVAGAGTALIWSLQGFARSLFRNRRLAKGAALGIRLATFWLKYFDHWFQHNPRACDFASATFFWGRRTDEPLSATELIRRYHTGK